jgi:cytoskeletal protein CcmA (bactofilin family)
VSAVTCAREVVVLRAVHGNIDATERVNISSEGSLIRDVITKRVSIAEGAFLKGSIDIQTPCQVNDAIVAPGISTANPSGPLSPYGRKSRRDPQPK